MNQSPARYPLAVLPTPLQPAVRLSAALAGPPILVKRDDLTGFALGGNKARKLEYLLGDALATRCEVLLTGGGPDSNHCQAAAAAARVAGLACELVLYGDEPRQPRLNLALARRSGASVAFTGDPDRASVDDALADRAEQLRAAGRRPYVIPRGGATPLGAVGYALAVDELVRQLAELGTDPEVVLVATGSCGTQAGLVAGTVAAGRRWRVVGATVSRPPAECRDRVLRLARGCAALLGFPAPRTQDVELRGRPRAGVRPAIGGRRRGRRPGRRDRGAAARPGVHRQGDGRAGRHRRGRTVGPGGVRPHGRDAGGPAVDREEVR